MGPCMFAEGYGWGRTTPENRHLGRRLQNNIDAWGRSCCTSPGPTPTERPRPSSSWDTLAARGPGQVPRRPLPDGVAAPVRAHPQHPQLLSGRTGVCGTGRPRPWLAHHGRGRGGAVLPVRTGVVRGPNRPGQRPAPATMSPTLNRRCRPSTAGARPTDPEGFPTAQPPARTGHCRPQLRADECGRRASSRPCRPNDWGSRPTCPRDPVSALAPVWGPDRGPR